MDYVTLYLTAMLGPFILIWLLWTARQEYELVQRDFNRPYLRLALSAVGKFISLVLAVVCLLYGSLLILNQLLSGTTARDGVRMLLLIILSLVVTQSFILVTHLLLSLFWNRLVSRHLI